MFKKHLCLFTTFVLLFLSCTLPACAAKYKDPAFKNSPVCWESEYDTADPDAYYEAGEYFVGIDFTRGLYHLSSTKQCDGAVLIYSSDNELIHTYDMAGGQECTIYLGFGMTISIPKHCTLECITYGLLIQPYETMRIIGLKRMIIHYELPHFPYEIEGRRDDSYYLISTISDEIGETTATKVEIPFGEKVRIEDFYTTAGDNMIIIELHNVYFKCLYN